MREGQSLQLNLNANSLYRLHSSEISNAEPEPTLHLPIIVSSIQWILDTQIAETTIAAKTS